MSYSTLTISRSRAIRYILERMGKGVSDELLGDILTVLLESGKRHNAIVKPDGEGTDDDRL